MYDQSLSGRYLFYSLCMNTSLFVSHRNETCYFNCLIGNDLIS